jgi:hypothetical protein
LGTTVESFKTACQQSYGATTESTVKVIPDTEITREALVAFYEKHNPEKVKNVDAILKNGETVEPRQAVYQEKYGAAPDSTVIPRAEVGGSTTVTDEAVKEAVTAPYSRDCAQAAMLAAKSQDRWSYLGYVAHFFAIAVVAMTWSGQVYYFHIASAVLVLLLMLLLLGYLLGYRNVSARTWIWWGMSSGTCSTSSVCSV